MLWSELKEMNRYQNWKGILKGRRAPGDSCPLWRGWWVRGRGLGCRKQPVLYSSCPCYRACRSLVPPRALNCAVPGIQMTAVFKWFAWWLHPFGLVLGKIFLVSSVPFTYATLLWIVSVKAEEHSFFFFKTTQCNKNKQTNRNTSIYFVQDMQIFNCLHFISCSFFLCYLLNCVFPALFFLCPVQSFMSQTSNKN